MYKRNPFENEVIEASMCPTCLKREKCEIKEQVAMEERIATSMTGHISVTVKCNSYVERKDKPPQEFFDRFRKDLDIINEFQKRGGRQ